jgi:hypothetical protein
VVIWGVFLFLTVFHIYANVRAVRTLRLTSLNCARLDVLLEHYLRVRIDNDCSTYLMPIWQLVLCNSTQ